jgi:hypothetical protein
MDTSKVITAFIITTNVAERHEISYSQLLTASIVRNIILMMEVVSTPETSVNFYKTIVDAK